VAPAVPAPVPVPAPASEDPTTPDEAAAEPDTDSLISPERYCAERRTEAAQAFASARSATDDSTRTLFLKRSLARLDDCLRRHPESGEAEKARQNRMRVEQELGR
jgi:hypothetical protein